MNSYATLCTVCGNTGTFTYTARSVRESYRCGFPDCRASLRCQGQAAALSETYDAIVTARPVAGTALTGIGELALELGDIELF
jgi:hypothetical protein